MLKRVILIFLVVSQLTACIYADVGGPLDTNVKETVLGPKKGESSVHSILGLVAWGDAGSAAAAKNGDIETINHLDAKYFIVFFGLYSKRTTVAYGD